MTERTFATRTWVRIDIETPAWLVVEAGQHLATTQPLTTFDTLEDAIEAGYVEPEDEWATIGANSEQGDLNGSP